MNELISAFSKPGQIAVVGATDAPRKFGGEVYRQLKKRGYRVYAVNPGATQVDGDRAFKTLRELPEKVEAAVIVVRPERAPGVIADAKAGGIKRIWFQQGADFAAMEKEAHDFGIETVRGKCILMYAGAVTGIHKFHQVLAKLFGRF